MSIISKIDSTYPVSVPKGLNWTTSISHTTLMDEQKMLAEIENVLDEGFERNLFLAAQNNLADQSNPLRLNNYAYAMRELTRYVLHRLAPDEKVLRCPWYKNETQKENGISRKQRAYYAVQGGLDNSYVESILELDVNEIHRDLVKVIDNLNKYTHIEPKVFDLPSPIVDTEVRKTTDAVYEFLTVIRDLRKLIIDSLWDRIDEAVIYEALRETLVSIDALATHHYIDEVYTHEVDIFEINHESIMFRAHGSIGCELQWGSNSDLRRGDGAVLRQDFPFTCELSSPVSDPEAVETIDDSVGVDTSSWTDVRYGQDEFE